MGFCLVVNSNAIDYLITLVSCDLTIHTQKKKQSDNSSAGIILKPTYSILESFNLHS